MSNPAAGFQFEVVMLNVQAYGCASRLDLGPFAGLLHALCGHNTSLTTHTT